jgi:lipoprotein-releasing system permease protein
MASGPDGVAGLILEGIEEKSATAVTDLPSKIRSGRMPRDAGEVLLTATVAEKLGVTAGSGLRIIIPSFGEEGAGAPKVIDAKVSGIARMGLHEYDTKYAFGRLDWVQSVVGLPGKISTFKIKLKDGSTARDVSNKLTENFGYPFRAKDWSQLNRNLFYAIQLEKVVIAIILTVIIIVAAFNVVSTLMMMIRDKTKEMSILKAMGLRRSETFLLFVLIGLVIGLVGIGIGIGSGLALNVILDQTKLITLPADVYYIGFLPVSINWGEIGLIAIAALLIVLLATVYPSIRASTQSPMDGIRYE